MCKSFWFFKCLFLLTFLKIVLSEHFFHVAKVELVSRIYFCCIEFSASFASAQLQLWIVVWNALAIGNQCVLRSLVVFLCCPHASSLPPSTLAAKWLLQGTTLEVTKQTRWDRDGTVFLLSDPLWQLPSPQSYSGLWSSARACILFNIPCRGSDLEGLVWGPTACIYLKALIGVNLVWRGVGGAKADRTRTIFSQLGLT